MGLKPPPGFGFFDLLVCGDGWNNDIKHVWGNNIYLSDFCQNMSLQLHALIFFYQKKIQVFWLPEVFFVGP